MTPWMHNDEILLILKHLYYTDTMLEWGSGGSTTYFPHFVNDYHSIEHDEKWSVKVQEELKSNNILNVNFHQVSCDSPRTVPTQRSQFETYIHHVDNLGVDTLDKVLIDGRARGWCAEYVLKYLHKDSLVFIHDFWNRPQYHIAFDWYDEVNSIKTSGTQTIVVLKPKKEYINNVIT